MLRILLFILTISSAQAFAQNNSELEYQFHKGFFVDTAGIKHNGYINIGSSKAIKYKLYKRSKEKKVKLKEVDNIFIANRNFVVLRNIKVKAEIGIVNEKYKNVLFEEIIFGRVRLFRTNIVTSVQTTVLSSISITLGIGSIILSKEVISLKGPAKHGEEFYFVKKENEEPFQIKTGNKKFRTQMLLLIEDNQKVLDSLNLENRNYYDLFNIIKKYNNNYIVINPNQHKIESEISDSIYLMPEQIPEYLPGKNELSNKVSNVEPTLYAKQNKKFGAVNVELIFDDKGKIIRIEVPDKIGYGLDEKAIEIVTTTNGNWVGAKNKGENVYSSIIILVDFKAYPSKLSEKAIRFYNKGLKLFKNKKYKNAVSFFEAATSINNNFIDAIYYRGSCYSHLNRKNEACDWWNKSLQLGLIDQDKTSLIKPCD